MYKLNVGDREYSTVVVIDCNTLSRTDVKINAPKHKLFTQDIFTINDDESVTIAHSSVRSMLSIPAVLVLEGNKMFGRYKNKFLYKCLPDDRRLPIFLVPYKIKSKFNKKLTNKYITFEFRHWEDKHPFGVISQTIGDVTELSCFYEYQLYCKSLHASIQDFTKKTMQKLKNKTEEEFVNQILKNNVFDDRRVSHDIITIDPPGSRDFDDAFSLTESDDICTLSIYIANVAIWMDALELWDTFTKRIATIYLPDRKRPMLPTILSDALCSLQEGRTRFAFTLDIIINKETSEIIDYKFLNTVICVNTNLRYETKEQENNHVYIKTAKLVNKLNAKYKYTETIANSHEFIAYIMILMNYLSAKELKQRKIGIYRAAKYKKDFKPPAGITDSTKKFLKMWNSTGGSYVKYENITGHEILDLDAYVHITSPIRRLVDLLNIVQLQESFGLLTVSELRTEFYNRWTNEKAFEYINVTMRSIRKVQNDCSLLEMCTTNQDIMTREHDGFIFDKIIRNDGLYQYMIFIPTIKMVSRVTSRHQIANHSYHKCKLYLFTDEIRLKKKVRISLM